jgi:hypothetical protein
LLLLNEIILIAAFAQSLAIVLSFPRCSEVVGGW